MQKAEWISAVMVSNIMVVPGVGWNGNRQRIKCHAERQKEHPQTNHIKHCCWSVCHSTGFDGHVEHSLNHGSFIQSLTEAMH